MPSIIQCPNCSKKLKLKAVPSGKKVKCPGCQTAFQPKAAGSAKKKAPPKRKKTAQVADDFVDFDDDEMYDDNDLHEETAAPARPRKAGAKGKKKQAASSGKRGAKKGASSKKSKAPLFIGLGVLMAALVGGGIFMMMTGGDDGIDDSAVADAGDATGGAAEDGSATADGTESTDATGDDTESEGSTKAGSSDTGTASASGTAGAEPQNPGTDTPGANTTNAVASSTPDPGSPTTVEAPSAAFASLTSNASSEITRSVSGQWLPANAEVVVVINVKQLLESPLKSGLPMLGQEIQTMKDAVGFGPEDIQSVTIGVGGISDAIGSGSEPDPNTTAASVVIRAASPVDSSKILSAIPNGEQVAAGSTTYVRVPDDDVAGAIWMADSTTAVIGPEPWIKHIATSYGGPPAIDASLFDGTSAIQIAFAPGNPDAIFRSMPLPPNSGSAEQQMLTEFLNVVQPTVAGIGIGLDINNDVVVTGAIKCASPDDATATSQALSQLISKGKVMVEQMPNGAGPPGVDPKAILDSFKTAANSQTATFSVTYANGGIMAGAGAPLMFGTMKQSIAAGRQAGERIRTVNNLRQLGLGLMYFHDAWGRFPNSTAKTDDGKPLLSWRVHILKYLGHEDLYNRFNVNEPWDSPTNRPLVDEMPAVFKLSNANVENGKTVFQVPVGPGTMFEGTTGRAMRDCTDGTSNTISIVVMSPERAVYWTKPEDYTWNPTSPTDGLHETDGYFMGVLLDGSVKRFNANGVAQETSLIFTRNDGTPLPVDMLQPAIPRPGGSLPPGFGPPGGGFGPGGGF